MSKILQANLWTSLAGVSENGQFWTAKKTPLSKEITLSFSQETREMQRVTEEQKKEAISKEFLRILAHIHGYKITESAPDHGVDITVCPVKERIDPNGQRHFLDSQMRLDFQIKSTTIRGIIEDDNAIKYDLEVKAFNDLITRRLDFLPLHLLLVVLSDNPPACVTIDPQQISVTGQAYWYLPEEDDQATANVATKRITIPKTNRLNSDFVRSCYERLEIEP